MLSVKVENLPKAPGLYRKDLTDHKADVNGMDWGISMTRDEGLHYLTRYEVEEKLMKKVSKWFS